MNVTTPMPMRRRHLRVAGLIPLGAIFALSLTLIAPAWSDTAGGPAIRLFPTSVLEDIKETGYVAEEMETGLQDVIARMDQQGQLYQDSKCDGAEGDPGCGRIAKQLGATYLEMLNVMNERLPDMERAVNATRSSLEKRLRGELGQKMTSWTLQENLLGNTPCRQRNAGAAHAWAFRHAAVAAFSAVLPAGREFRGRGLEPVDGCRRL